MTRSERVKALFGVAKEVCGVNDRGFWFEYWFMKEVVRIMGCNSKKKRIIKKKFKVIIEKLILNYIKTNPGEATGVEPN